MDKQELHRLARLGASARLLALEEERAALLRSFPGLRAASAASARASGAQPAGRKRSRMSAAARKAVSVRMKKYWAARRKAKSARS